MMSVDFNERVEKAKEVLNAAGTVLIGAGSGLSTAAGLEYTGRRFYDNFRPFIEKYGFKDLYTSSFYPFKTEEERWAYWARHISINRFEVPVTYLYTVLFELVKTKNYFVITTNVDGQFIKAGFSRDRLFEVQGNYAYLQCSVGCHNQLYYNEKIVAEMLASTENCRIHSRLVPKCPKCGNEMDVNLRKDHYFVQDENWYEAETNYSNFLSSSTNDPIVYFELGVGYNTPGIIRYPFEEMVHRNPMATLIRINKDHPEGFSENHDSTIAFDEEIKIVFDNLRKNTSSILQHTDKQIISKSILSYIGCDKYRSE